MFIIIEIEDPYSVFIPNLTRELRATKENSLFLVPALGILAEKTTLRMESMGLCNVKRDGDKLKIYKG